MSGAAGRLSGGQDRPPDVDAPALPVTLDELVSTAKACQAAGAGLIHIHIRDAEARPTLDVGRLTATVEAVREATDLVVQLSTGGAVTDPFEALGEEVRRRVKAKSGVELEWEIKRVGRIR